MSQIKQVIVIRKDLKMRRGKEIAQGAHAAMNFLVERIRNSESNKATNQVSLPLATDEHQWINDGMAKVCVQAASEDELLQIFAKAKEAQLQVHMIRDSGRTEFGGQPTLTALAIGPAEAAAIDVVTGHLLLY